MTAYPDLDRRLADFYAGEAPQQAPDWLLGAALETIDTTPQRRSLVWVPWRFPIMSAYAKVAVAAVAVVAVGAVGLAVLRPAQGPGTEPPISPSPSSQSSAAPDASPPTALPRAGDLQAGIYTLGDTFGKPITLAIPDGWSACSSGSQEQAVCGPPSDIGMAGVLFTVIENVVEDPCGSTPLDPPVGPSVDELVQALSALDGFQVTPPVDVTIDGYTGKQLQLTAPDDGRCDRKTWITASGINGVGPGEISSLRVLDLDGERLVISGNFGGSQAIVEQILESISIGP